MGDDPNFATTVTTSIATKAPLVHTHVAADVTDFDAEVSNNTSVAANTLKVTFPGFGTTAGTALEGDTVLFDGVYSSLTGKPTLFSESYNDLSDLPTLFDGNYNSLSNLPTLGTAAAAATTDFAAASHTHVIADITGLQTALDGAGDANVQSDWDETDSADDSFILNKPTVPSGIDDLSDVDTTTIAASTGDVLRWSGTAWAPDAPASGGTQSDWDETDAADPAFILNKPTAVADLEHNYVRVLLPSSHLTGGGSQIDFDLNSKTQVTGFTSDETVGSGLTFASDQFTAGNDGLYTFNASAEFKSTVTQRPAPTLHFRVNGTEVEGKSLAYVRQSNVLDEATANLTRTFNLTSGDTVQVWFQNQGVVGSSVVTGEQFLFEGYSHDVTVIGIDGTIGDDNVQSDWNQTDAAADDFILNKPTIPTAFSGVYNDLTGKPTLFSEDYNDLSNLPTLFDGAYGSLTGAPTLFDGAYTSLSGLPTLFDGAYSSLSGLPTLFDGAYTSLSGLPTLGTAAAAATGDFAAASHTHAIADVTGLQTALDNAGEDNVQADWNESDTGADSFILNKPTIPTAFSGVYNDLTGKPTLFSEDYNDLTNLPTLFDGAYASLSGKPTLFDGDYNSLSNLPTLFDGTYSSLTGKPTLVTSVDGLSDVDTTTAAPTTGDILEWDGTNWVPATPSGGGATTRQFSNDAKSSMSSGEASTNYLWPGQLQAGKGDADSDVSTNPRTNSSATYSYCKNLGHRPGAGTWSIELYANLSVGANNSGTTSRSEWNGEDVDIIITKHSSGASASTLSDSEVITVGSSTHFANEGTVSLTGIVLTSSDYIVVTLKPNFSNSSTAYCFWSYDIDCTKTA